MAVGRSMMYQRWRVNGVCPIYSSYDPGVQVAKGKNWYYDDERNDGTWAIDSPDILGADNDPTSFGVLIPRARDTNDWPNYGNDGVYDLGYTIIGYGRRISHFPYPYRGVPVFHFRSMTPAISETTLQIPTTVPGYFVQNHPESEWQPLLRQLSSRASIR